MGGVPSALRSSFATKGDIVTDPNPPEPPPAPEPQEPTIIDPNAPHPGPAGPVRRDDEPLPDDAS